MTTQTMRGVHIYAYGGTEPLKLEEMPCSEPQAGEALLRVYAAGVNPIDWKIRQGLMKNISTGRIPFYSRHRDGRGRRSS